MAEIAIKVAAAPVANWTMEKLWQELGYVFCYKSNIEDLNKQVQDLRDKRDGVGQKVNTGGKSLKDPAPGVDRWISDVDKIITEKETNFKEETVAAKAACWNGRLPNFLGRFSLGRKAKKMTENVKDLLAKEPKTIVGSARLPVVESQPPEDSTHLGTNFHEGASSSGTSNHEQPRASERTTFDFHSRRLTIEGVMEALKGNQINPIIICGLGGMGKTTLMRQVHHRAMEESLFDEYTEATFKESLDKDAEVIGIQDELAEYLGEKLLKGIKARGPRASKLNERLVGKKILVMLDNVWTTTPGMLGNIGIPPSCQLLVTSRQQDLFNDMDTRKDFPIGGLSDDDAWRLFKQRAGSSIESDPELHVVAEKILKKCGGSPIAISTVGTALKGKSIEIWNDALEQLENPCPANEGGVIDHVYWPITFSYESLPAVEAKSCFLLCCVFGGSSDIRIEDLVRHGLGLGLFNFKDTDSMVKGRNRVTSFMVKRRNRVKSLVQTLKSRFLLLDVDGDPERVRMHDVVRDVALHIASEAFIPKINDAVEKRIVVRDNAATVKLMDWPISEQSAVCRSLFIGGLCVLLQYYTSEVDPPHTIFNKTEHLKVLEVKQCQSLQLSSLRVLRNIQTLRLQYCRVEDVSVIGELSTLMILSLRGCKGLEELPVTFKNLSRLRLLDLVRCTDLKIISPGVIKSLFRLEELYMRHTFQDWAVEKLASPETATWISQLDTTDRRTRGRDSGYNRSADTWKRLNQLAVEQPGAVGELFRQEIGHMFPLISQEEFTRWANSMDWNTGILVELLSLSRLTTLEAVLPPVNILLTSPLFNNLERFKISVGWEDGAWDSETDGLDDNYLRVGNLDPSAIVDSGMTPFLQKTSIIELHMTNSTQPQLMNVLRTVCFAKILSLALKRCNDVKYLIDTAPTPNSSSSAIFPVLKALDIDGPDSLKEIFHGELPTGSLKELRSLRFRRLPGLVYIWRTNRKSEFGKEIWNNPLSAESLCELRTLRVEQCFNLLHLVPTHMQNRLQKLECIDVSYCASLKEIFDDEGDATTISESGDQGAQINKMTSFKQSPQAFQNLRGISIMHCESLRTLLSPSVARGLVMLQRLTIGECSSIKEVVAAAAEGEETEDDNMFPQLHTLVLENLPNLGSFSEGKYNFKWPQVKKIRILDCCKMKKFCSGPLSTPKKVEIKVEGAGESVLPQLNDSRQEI